VKDSHIPNHGLHFPLSSLIPFGMRPILILPYTSFCRIFGLKGNVPSCLPPLVSQNNGAATLLFLSLGGGAVILRLKFS